MTDSPTSSPTAEPNQTPYFLILIFYSIFCLFLLSCGATIYRSANRRTRFQLKLQELNEQYVKAQADKANERADVKKAGEEKETQIKESLNKLYGPDFYSDFADHYLEPITDSTVSKTMSKLLFHTSLGRVLVNLESKLEGSFLAILQYMLSLQGVEVFRYYSSISGFPQQTMLAQFFGLLVAYVLFLLLNMMKEEFVRSRMGGDMNILEKEN